MATGNHCISYLDEAKHYGLGPTKSVEYYTIVSFTAKTDDYISKIEPEWRQLRLKHGFPDGQVIHFTDVKLLMNPSLPIEKYKAYLLQIFSKTKSPVSKDFDYSRLHAFFLDVLDFIKRQPLVIHATGIKTDKAGIVRKINNRYFKGSTYLPPYHAFREHLNLMSLYLMDVYSGNYDPDKTKFSFTKLRFDGDIDLGERDDLREAFNHCISLGTRHFRPNFVKKAFDEIRFVGKNEVAQFTPNGITHAGNEITDFITMIIARHIWQHDTDKNTFLIPGLDPLDPIPYILPKLKDSQCLIDNFL